MYQSLQCMFLPKIEFCSTMMNLALYEDISKKLTNLTFHKVKKTAFENFGG